jgi:hypothetical protein
MRTEEARTTGRENKTMKTYKIMTGEGTPAGDQLARRRWRTLSGARAALREFNGGRLHGRFVTPSEHDQDGWDAVEGYTLGRSSIAVILRELADEAVSRIAIKRA